MRSEEEQGEVRRIGMCVCVYVCVCMCVCVYVCMHVYDAMSD
jgi:hypothetical protein